MPIFYFTYGSEGHPYYGGWTEVEAPDSNAACAAFRAYHPDQTLHHSMYAASLSAVFRSSGNIAARSVQRWSLLLFGGSPGQ